MSRIRLELTGSGEDVLRTAGVAGGGAVARAETAKPAAGVLSLDEIIDRIHRELKRRSGAPGSATASTTADAAHGHLPRWQSSVAPLPIQPMYVLADMLRPSDGEFVDNAFRILLRRPARAEERAQYLARLRGGMSKVEILGTIRFSEEGLHRGVHVDGLLIPYKLHKWRRVPVLGWFLATGIAVFRLPRLFASLQGLESASAQESQQLGRVFNDLAQAIEARQTRLEEQLDALAGLQRRVQAELSSLSAQAAERVSQLETAMMARVDKLEAATAARLEAVQADQAGMHAQWESRLAIGLSAMAKATAQGVEIRRSVHDIERQLMTLSDRMKQQATGSAAVAAPSGPGEDQSTPGLAAHYVSFEDTFRGTRDDIKARAGHYLTAFHDAGIEPGDGLVLDLGCGRGEWLEVLSEHGYASRGVDLNGVMVREAQTLGLDAIEQDVIAHLRSLGSESVSAITSMHLVEHLPYEVLIRMVDEALRVLRPGGVLILETPNPENLTVGSYWFYMDPTHRNPIPPPLLQWIVEARGFEHAAIDRLTQNRAVFDIQPVGEEVAAANQINKIVGLLTAAPDYAIVARKPGPEITHGQGA
jgi:O-antigen chain-terminating methyltransferase